MDHIAPVFSFTLTFLFLSLLTPKSSISTTTTISVIVTIFVAKMRFSFVALLSATAALAAPSQVSEGKKLEAREGFTRIVQVTEGGIYPSQLQANQGDFIWFKFGSGFNSVVEGEYNRPCRSYGNGFASGTVYHSGNGFFGRVFIVDVGNTSPRWYYSGEGTRCIDKAHVAVINPPSNNPNAFASYYSSAPRAKRVDTHSERGGQFENDEEF
ncbi:hypothetical protein Cpir12675_001591 [Ceratocystis pirilliformis]|uniref:Uncharacterized protein n=1 Tax=Ceratocystis pirilliformis TaxID=259994 RepID=A0ABR3ZEE3_9PEZI